MVRLPSIVRIQCLVTVLAVCVASPAAMGQKKVEVAANAQAAAGGWTPELMMKVRRVAHVRPSPPIGNRVAYTVAEPVMTDDRSEYVSQIWVAQSDGTRQTRMTFATKSSTNPVWSRDGSFLAFTSERTGKSNLFVMRRDGGEAEQLTDVKSGVGAFAWSHNGQQIAFVMTDAPTDAEEKSKKAKDDSRWVDRNHKMDRLYVLEVPPRWWPHTTKRPDEVEETGKTEPRLLTPGNFTIGAAARPGGGSFDWAPGGKSIVFAHRKTPLADDWPTSDVSVVDVASGEITPLATTGASEFAPLFSPNGRLVAMVVSDDPVRWAGSYTLQVVPAGGGQPKSLPATFDHQPTLIGWSNDESRLYFSETHGTLNRLFAIHVDSGKLDELYAGNELLRSFDLSSGGSMFGFVLESPHRAPEAFVSGVAKLSPKQVSRANADLPSTPLGKVEVIRWKSFDGREIEGLLTYPVGYQPGRRVPLLLQIHGGPMGVFVQSYAANPAIYPNAAFASRGFAILQPNPRGSTGYGREFRFANYEDWGGGDFKDLMAGVDHVIEQGIADPDRLGVMGWSYGGYMTSWTITQTRRFRAASVGAAVTNLASFTGTADIPSFLRDYLNGEPWEDSSLYRGRSAVFNAKGVTTATLIQHGEADVRVPVSQGYEFYNALKRQCVPVEMLVLPRQPHGPTEPRMILKLLQTNLDWFEKHLGPESASRAAGS